MYKALKTLKSHKNKLTQQEFRTLRGQIFNGDKDGAMKGLSKLIKKVGRNDE